MTHEDSPLREGPGLMYGSFPARFHAPVRAVVAGKRVLDLGAGSCARARILTRLDAAAVLAVDVGENMRPAPRIQLVEGYFHAPRVVKEVAAFDPQVLHLAWPSPAPTTGLGEFVLAASVVVYVGKNTERFRCGTPLLFDHFRYRPVLAYEPTPTNVLIVYGALRSRARTRLYPEEIAGLDPDWGSLAYDPGRKPVPWKKTFVATPQPRAISTRGVPTYYPATEAANGR